MALEDGYTVVETFNALKITVIARFDDMSKRFDPFCTKWALKTKIDELRKEIDNKLGYVATKVACVTDREFFTGRVEMLNNGLNVVKRDAKDSSKQIYEIKEFQN
jgi:hypothetical protein